METTEHETNDAINWFTGEVIHSSFLKSRDIGYQQIREMENMIIKQNANGSTKTLKKELKSRKTVQPFPGSSQYAHVTVQQTKQPPLKVIPTEVNKTLQDVNRADFVLDEQPFLPQFSRNGTQKVTTTKSAIKELLSKEFGLKADGNPSIEDYKGILIDTNYSLYRTPPEQCKNIQQMTGWFVNKNIKPLLHNNVTLVMCFDKARLVPFIKGQERLERGMKNDAVYQEDHSFRLLQLYQPGPVLDSNHAPPISLIRSSREIRDQYLHCIIKDICTNPSKYLPLNKSFILVFDGDSHIKITRLLFFTAMATP